jgi:hypothetical protein
MIYYPLAKITPNLFTSGNEFAILNTGQDYKGYYFSTYDGKFFTDKLPSEISVELVKYSAKKPLTSLASIKYAIQEKDQPEVVHTITAPTQQDYEAGSFLRYFVKRVNGDESTIMEISLDTYNELQDNPLYITEETEWFISGAIENTTTPEGILVPGVSSKNQLATSKLNKAIPGISAYLKNPLQFYK